MFLKIKYNDKILKIKYENISLPDLKAAVRSKCEIGAEYEFNLAYLDADGDIITLLSTDDLVVGVEEAEQNSTSNADKPSVPTLNLIVSITNSAQMVMEADASAQKQATAAPITFQVNAEQTKPAPVAAAGNTEYPPMPTGITIGNKGTFQGGVFAASPAPQATQSSLFSNAAPNSGLFSNVVHQPASVQIGVPLIQHTFAHIRPAPAPICTVLPHNPTDAVHYGISCDKCKRNPIRGKRYKSVTRLNFDLCSNCVTKHPFCYEKFLLIPYHNPHDSSIRDENMRPVYNHFKGLGCVPTLFQNRQRHSFYYQLVNIFPNDNKEEMNDFLWELDGFPYEVVYTNYITKYHLGY